MKPDTNTLKESIREAGLRVTPQRMAVLEAVLVLENHPTVEQVLHYVRGKHPGIATGTVYHILDTLAEHQLIARVKTDHEVMRYDGFMKPHHHIYTMGTDRITDYSDPELDEMLKEYFSRNAIPGVEIREIRLQIIGKVVQDNEKTIRKTSK